jgi:hypothetical protein
MLAELLLTQSGPITEFGPLDQGDQICIDSLQVTVEGIRIVASYGDKQAEYFLQAVRQEAGMFDDGFLLANTGPHGPWRMDLDQDQNSEAMLLVVEIPPHKHPVMLVPVSPAQRRKETTQLQLPLPNGEKDIDDLIAALQELKDNLHE